MGETNVWCPDILVVIIPHMRGRNIQPILLYYYHYYLCLQEQGNNRPRKVCNKAVSIFTVGWLCLDVVTFTVYI